MAGNFVCIIAVLLGSAAANLEVDVPNVINQFWTLASGSDDFVDALSLEIFYKPYENVIQTQLLVIESWFTTGPDSWVSDFNVSTEVARGYFRLLDDYWREHQRDNTQRISVLDCEFQVRAGDTDLDSSLTETEFKAGYNKLLLDRMPFSVMFVRYMFDNFNFEDYYEYLAVEDFRRFFGAIDGDSSGSITADEMATYYTSSGLGSATSGQTFFNATLTTPGATSISAAEWDNLFYWLADPVLETIVFEEFMCLYCLLEQYKSNPGDQYTNCGELDVDLERFRCERDALS